MSSEQENIDGFESLFDYDKITDNDKKLITEIIKFLRSREQVPISLVIEELKTKFKIVEVPMKPVEESIWYEFTKDEKIGASIQGFRETKIDGKKIRIPHIAFSADLDVLDGLINRVIKKFKEMSK